MRQPANPVLWLVIVLPLLAVAGSIASLTLAFTRGDEELPKIYHWEGAALERDQQQQELARRLGIGATIGFDAAAGRCAVALHVPAPAPAALLLTLTHPTATAGDRRIRLERQGEGYLAPCPPLPMAHWWLELTDAEGHWLLRGRVLSDLRRPVSLGTGPPEPR